METNCESPYGKVFGHLAKAYADAYTERMRDLPIDRYFYALVVIDDYDGDLSQTLLADELMVDKAMVVRMLDYLEDNDCIIRKSHPKDRRTHLLELTQRAHDLIPEIKKGIRETNAICSEIAEKMGLKNLNDLFDKMGSALLAQGKGTFKIHFVRNEENEK